MNDRTSMRVPCTTVIGVCLFLMTVAVCFPALDARMVADDFHIVQRLSLGDALQSLHDTVGYSRNEYRPLIAFSFAFSNALWRGNPRGYHLDSILLHALNVSLLFAWLVLLTKSPVVSGAAAILFAVHPVHHARIVWIAARDGLLSALFMLVALIAYVLARRRQEQGPVQMPGSATALRFLSVGSFIASLLSYEGAVILPGILIGLELFLFNRPESGLRQRLMSAFARALPYALVLIAYLAWWLFLFKGSVGQYALSFNMGSMLHNYYSLWYQLFHGNSHLAGLLYFVLVAMGLLLSHKRLALIWFSVLLMLLGYLPFVIIDGFASRFAYTSTMGYALLLALLLAAGTFHTKTSSRRALRFVPVPLTALILIVLAGYYTSALRFRISEWKIAGEIAEDIPRHIKTHYPDLKDGSTVVLARIPRMYGHAYVYPLGLESSIERLYSGRNLQVFYGSGAMEDVLSGKDSNSPDTVFFEYIPEQGDVEEVVAARRSR